MILWSPNFGDQKSALIQPRTSLAKSDVAELVASYNLVSTFSIIDRMQGPGAWTNAAIILCSCGVIMPRRSDLLLSGWGSSLSTPSPSARHLALSEARSRLYRRRSLQVNNHFAAFFKIYKICTLLHRSGINILEKIQQNCPKFQEKRSK